MKEGVWAFIATVAILGAGFISDQAVSGMITRSKSILVSNEVLYVPCDKRGAEDLYKFFKENYRCRDYCKHIVDGRILPRNNKVRLTCKSNSERVKFFGYCREAKKLVC